MAVARTPRQAWIEQGLQTLAARGVAAVRIEVLAKALGVTKGGFYGYFADRNALLEEMLDTWERESIDDVLARVEDEDDPRVKIVLAGQLTLSRERLLAIDLAIRDWARRDAAVAERLRRVDNRRMALLRSTIGTFCDDPDEIEARSLLAFCAAIGNQFLVADHNGRTRDEVLARASAIILDRPADRPSPGS
ncbi:putative TetR family transcriptional regulator [Nocardia brasiliensis NBRC 14402]|uniref:TetR/AcrR family transcriptional regulator n=1 Tax=Nocardia brasiliensis TaxID=37326 RepID=UPI0002FCF9EA|nr:TetR family transcriptional regulator [Nocardia brasiliensis]ASF12244.1 TetR family transcriptional regulator [Nocardia brasiliensis]GAJ79180.1 putative TetR family transcriptional regulator [Nocardia brasiliensis NBRC 14402]SUB53172.1 transcriptional regulator BetI [Nocardia brasiliensis]